LTLFHNPHARVPLNPDLFDGLPVGEPAKILAATFNLARHDLWSRNSDDRWPWVLVRRPEVVVSSLRSTIVA
jgi:hypothetical protein